MTDNKGFRIWKVAQNGSVSVLESMDSVDVQDFMNVVEDLDLENNTYAIRIGKGGLR